MKVIAHRGANREALENSWTAFRTAIDAGAERLELDVWLTKDNEIVVMHDESLERTAGVRKDVKDLTRAELQKIKLLNGEPIPFLDELFAELLSKIEINVEIKDIDTDLCDKLVEIAKPYNIAGRVVVSSFESQPLEYLSENFPEIDIACLYGDVGRWPQMSYASPLVFMARTRAKIIHPWTHWLTPSFMDQAKSRGWKVYTYSEMNGDEARDPEGVWTTLKTLGVDGHCTNFPREFKAWLTQLERRTID